MPLNLEVSDTLLRPPQRPKFPFSSPITEEVGSPNGSSSEEGTPPVGSTGFDQRDNIAHAGFQGQSGSSSKNIVMEVGGQQPEVGIARYVDLSQVRHELRKSIGIRQVKNGSSGSSSSSSLFSSSSSSSSASSSSRRNSHGISKKSQRPTGLHLVTNFSRNDHKKGSTNHKHSDDKGPGAAFVDLNDLKALSKARDKERSPNMLKQALRKATNPGWEELKDEPTTDRNESPQTISQRQSDALKSSKNYLYDEKYELSPSDAPIMIGIKVPYEESATRRKTTDDNATTPRDPNSAQSQPTPITPSIIITPAIENVPWSADSPEHHRPRATSSIYSQPTPHIGSFEPEGDIPPVPAIPAFHSVVKGNSPEGIFASKFNSTTRRDRPLSTDTFFEEDETPKSGNRARAFSDESKRMVLHRLSVNTETNRHQSQGWWTYLLSPLLTRSNTAASRKGPTATEHPPLPPLSALSAVSASSKESSVKWWEEDGKEKEMSYFSPDTPAASANRDTRVDSAWVDGENTRDISDSGPPLDTTHNPFYVTDATGVQWPAASIQGAAAEYYQACAHDLFSKEPYFECVNHICSLTPASRIAELFGDGGADESGDKALPLTMKPETTKEVANSNNPFLSNEEHEREVVSAGGHAATNPFVDEAGAETSRELDTSTAAPVSRSVERTQTTGQSRTRAAAPATSMPVEEEPTEEEEISGEDASSTPAPPPPYSPPQKSVPKYRAILPPTFPNQPHSPGPISPGMQEAMTSRGEIPLSSMPESQGPQRVEVAIQHNFVLPPRPAPVPVTDDSTAPSFAAREEIENRRRRHEKEEAVAQKVGGFWRGRGCFSNKGCFGRPGREGRIRRRWYVAISGLCLAILIVAIVLATTLTHKGQDTPVQSQWLNLTGYPPMPTGVMTIAGPEAQAQNNGCIQPSTLWSCALPKEQQAANAPFAANQPNFRIQISFLNGTYPNSTEVAPSTTSKRKRSKSDQRGGYGAFLSRPSNTLRTRDSSPFDTSPAPPSIADQEFLGNTTDDISIPFQGEETPFFITILSPVEVSSASSSVKLDKRNNFPNVSTLIPPPSLASDGTAAAANLYPLPVAQPVRLYNRGQPTEHYGFYTYFDRSIFLKSNVPLNGSADDTDAADQNGGSPKDQASVRCTWAQTRFLVQIWTQPSNISGMVLQTNFNSSSSATTAAAASSPTPSSYANNASSSSANDFVRPGSFPYPATIKLDRHGGDASSKLVYCYGMDANGNIVSSEKKLEIENRGFGGHLINPAPGIFSGLDTSGDSAGNSGGSSSTSALAPTSYSASPTSTTSTAAAAANTDVYPYPNSISERSITQNSSSGGQGIDGGTGGCDCEWVNWALTGSS